VQQKIKDTAFNQGVRGSNPRWITKKKKSTRQALKHKG